MKENFTPEDLNLYGDYFERLQKHLQANFSPSTPDQVSKFHESLIQKRIWFFPQVQQPPKDCGLKEVLESALLLENPKSYYENISFGFRIFILVTKLLPTYYADRMKLRMWGSSVGYKLVWIESPFEIDFDYISQIRFIIRASQKSGLIIVERETNALCGTLHREKNKTKQKCLFKELTDARLKPTIA